jgi:hypothetical protein
MNYFSRHIIIDGASQGSINRGHHGQD